MIGDTAYELQGFEFFRPLCQGWLSKIEGALSAGPRKRWKEQSDECLMFYNRSAAAMWDPTYARKFWRNVKAPKFRITINKAFEFVAVFVPNLLWDVPHRTVNPKNTLEIPQELFAAMGPQGEQIYQQLMQEAGMQAAKDRLIAHLMQAWLNYTPREMPGNGLAGHNELAVLDAMIKGMGCLWPAVYQHPGSQRSITGCFRKPAEDLIIDPDFKTIDQAKWIALRHLDAHWEVERRFNLPANSLKNKSAMESHWHYGEASATFDKNMGDRKSGKTNDLVLWYEIWSKMGPGTRMTGMPEWIKGQLEETVGDYAHLAICPDCPYPLNCPSDKIRGGASEAEIRQCFEWPVPLWADSRWPVERLMFYEDTESPWGVPPLAPAMGELKFLNFIIPWLCNRIYSSSRDFWAVVGSHFDEYKKYLEDGEDQVVFPLSPGVEDVRTQIMTLQQPETRADAWKVVELVSSLFDKRTGLTEFGAYGINQDGTQNRTAEETQAKQKAFGVRPEYMQKKVGAWQSRAANVEAMLAWMFIKGQDTFPLLGHGGSMLWDQHVAGGDFEVVMRQMGYDIAAASIRRPDRDRDIANLNEIQARWVPAMQKYGELNGDWEPLNGVIKKWGELHDMPMDGMYFPAKDPNDPQAQLAQAQQQAEVRKTNAEAAKAEAEAQADPAEQQRQEMQLEAAKAQQEAVLEREKHKAEMAMKLQELQMKAVEAQQKMALDQQKMKADLAMQVQKTQADTALRLKEQQQKSELEAVKTKADMDTKMKTESMKWQGEAQKQAQEMQLKVAESAIQMALKKMETEANIKLEKTKADNEKEIKDKQVKQEAQNQKNEKDTKAMADNLSKAVITALSKIQSPVVNIQQAPAQSTKRKVKVNRDKDGRIAGLETD